MSSMIGDLGGKSGGNYSQGGQSSGLNFRNQDLSNIRDSQAALGSQTGQFQGQADNAYSQGMQNVGNIQTDFGAKPLDAFSNQLISGEQGRQMAGLNTQQNQISQQFQNNPGLANILNQQASNTQKLQQNPLAFAAQQNQMQRQQAGNQAQLQQLGARGQTLGFAQQGLGAQQNMLGQNLGVGQALAQQAGTNQGQQNQRQGGLFENTAGMFGANGIPNAVGSNFSPPGK